MKLISGNFMISFVVCVCVCTGVAAKHGEFKGRHFFNQQTTFLYFMEICGKNLKFHTFGTT